MVKPLDLIEMQTVLNSMLIFFMFMGIAQFNVLF